MSKRIFPVVLLSLLAVGQAVFAKQVCNTISECQDVISQAQARLQELSNVGGQRTSNTGAVFTRDGSIPALGAAYKDPSGLIWGSIVTAQGKTSNMDQYDADEYCKDGGTRLPTKEEFQQLAKYLGEGTAQGYSPFLSDGKTEILPGLSGEQFWSSSLYPGNSDYAFAFKGGNGYVGFADRLNYVNFRYAVRCVADARR